MKKVLIVVIVLALAAVALGALAVTPKSPEVPIVKIRPLYEHLIESPQNWKDAYGDTLEARFVYNLAVLRNNQLEIAKMIAKLHPPVEPNLPIDPNE